MANITTRAAKGSPLSHTEMDQNLTALNNDLSSKAVIDDTETSETTAWSSDRIQDALDALGSPAQDGNSVLHGSGVPLAGLGTDGDFYINTFDYTIYGPKTTTWGSPTSLVGPAGMDGQDGLDGATGAQGPTGPQGDPGTPGTDGQDGSPGLPGSDGQDGRTVLNGSGSPSAGLGVSGDFYIDTSTWTIYGPKSGSWPSGTPLVGPSGSDGVDGLNGSDGAPGDNGPGVPLGGTTGQILAKSSNTDLDTEWIDPPSGGGGAGGSSVYSFQKRSSTSTSNASPSLTIPWDVDVDDYASDVSWSSANPTRFVAESGGVYEAGCSVVYQSATQRAQASVEILINGVSDGVIRGGSYIRNSGSSWDFWPIEVANTPFTLNAGDYVEFRLVRTSGAAANYSSGDTGTLTLRGQSCLGWLKRVA